MKQVLAHHRKQHWGHFCGRKPRDWVKKALHEKRDPGCCWSNVGVNRLERERAKRQSEEGAGQNETAYWCVTGIKMSKNTYGCVCRACSCRQIPKSVTLWELAQETGALTLLLSTKISLQRHRLIRRGKKIILWALSRYTIPHLADRHPYRNPSRRTGWTSASCTPTPLAWWPRSDRRVGGPSGCSRRRLAGGWSSGRWIAASLPASAGWRGGGCALRRPGSGGSPLTCSRWSWPGRGCRGSSAHRLGERRRRKTRAESVNFKKAGCRSRGNTWMKEGLCE